MRWSVLTHIPQKVDDHRPHSQVHIRELIIGQECMITSSLLPQCHHALLADTANASLTTSRHTTRLYWPSCPLHCCFEYASFHKTCQTFLFHVCQILGPYQCESNAPSPSPCTPPSCLPHAPPTHASHSTPTPTHRYDIIIDNNLKPWLTEVCSYQLIQTCTHCRLTQPGLDFRCSKLQ